MIEEMILLALKPFLPQIKKNIKKGGLNGYFDKIKEYFEKKYTDLGEKSIDFVLTKEKNIWYFSCVIFEQQDNIITVNLLESIPVQDAIEIIFNNM